MESSGIFSDLQAIGSEDFPFSEVERVRRELLMGLQNPFGITKTRRVPKLGEIGTVIGIKRKMSASLEGAVLDPIPLPDVSSPACEAESSCPFRFPRVDGG